MQSSSTPQQAEESLRALQDIRGIMERSARFLSLSGWSGIWAGCTALAASGIAWKIMGGASSYHNFRMDGWQTLFTDPTALRLLLLALATFAVALAGGLFFTARKAAIQGARIWGHSSMQLLIHILVPMAIGGVFVLAFLEYDTIIFIAPACLAFYGLALVNGSKFTLGEIRWLGYSELLLAMICLAMPGYGLYFMAAGFGLLHILYGVVMWNRYEKRRS